MPAAGFVTGPGNGKEYPGNLTPYVTFTCIVAAMGGLIFGYDIGISGGVTSIDPFLQKFFPSVYEKQQANSSTNQYCKFDSQTLSRFTSSLYLAALVSSLVASTVTRKLGRKLSMLLGGLFFLAGALINGFAQKVWMLIVGRILLGFGIGFANQIVWQPYRNLDDYPEYCTRGRDMWHCSVPLICNEKIEFHPADRFMRQFAFVQVVSTYIWKPKRGHGNDRRYGIKPDKKHDWPGLFEEFITVWNDHHNRLINDEFGTGTSPNYIRWYRERTRIFINPPELGLPSHGFREHTSVLNKMKVMLCRNFKSFNG